MKNKNKIFYEAPKAETLELKTQEIICASGNSGTQDYEQETKVW